MPRLNHLFQTAKSGRRNNVAGRTGKSGGLDSGAVIPVLQFVIVRSNQSLRTRTKDGQIEKGAL